MNEDCKNLHPTDDSYYWNTCLLVVTVVSEVFKVIARDKKSGRQYKKWTYVSRDDFDKYSPEIIRRYSRAQWDKKEFNIEIYKLVGTEWEILDENVLSRTP